MDAHPANKIKQAPTILPLNPIPSREVLPFKQISYNLITNLPISNRFDPLLVMVDQGLSKGVILCPTKKTTTAKGVATIIFQKLYTRFGLFNKIISNRGPQFAARFQKELGRILRYELALSSTYHLHHPLTICKPTEKWKGSTKNWKLTYGFSVETTPLTGLNKPLWLNLSITSDPTLQLEKHHSTSLWDMNPKHSLISPTKLTSLLIKKD